MPFANSPLTTQDILNLLADSLGIKVQGPTDHDAPGIGKPVPIGGLAITGSPSAVADGDAVNARFDELGHQGVMIGGDGNNSIAAITSTTDGHGSLNLLGVLNRQEGLAPDAAYDIIRLAGNIAPALGALNVALIGGDITLRASAVAGEASGTSTQIDNLGWVSQFAASLDVSAAPTGGSPLLDVYIQTQQADGGWQDIVHFTQATGITHENVAWGGGDGNLDGIGAEGSAITFDRFYADEDASIAATTIRITPLGDSMRTKHVFVAGGSTGDFTFSVLGSFHSH